MFLYSLGPFLLCFGAILLFGSCIFFGLAFYHANKEYDSNGRYGYTAASATGGNGKPTA